MMLLWFSMVFVGVAHGFTNSGDKINKVSSVMPVKRPGCPGPLCFLRRANNNPMWPCRNGNTKPPSVPPGIGNGNVIFTVDIKKEQNRNLNNNGKKDQNKNCNYKDNNNGNGEDDNNGNVIITSKEKKFFVVQCRESWMNAVHKCIANNQRLASIRNQKEQDLLKQTIQNQGLDKDCHQFWIGGSDLANNGNFVWLDCEPMTYTNWDRNQPDNHNNNEHCMAVVSYNEYRWNDLNCDANLYYVCEYY